MYTFAIELRPKTIQAEVWQPWHFRIEEEYRRRKPDTLVQVYELPDKVFRVQFREKDYNFNWCFSVSDHLTLVAFEITIEDIVMPPAFLGESNGDDHWRAFPHPEISSDLYCELTINSAEQWVKVRTTLTDRHHWNDYREGMMGVVQGVLNIAPMTKWTMRMVKGYSENNFGLARRAQGELLKAIASSAPFLTLP